jgi:hypothetical protein
MFYHCASMAKAPYPNSGMIETHQNPKFCPVSNFFILA